MVLSSKSSSNVLNSLSLRVALAKVYRLANVVFSVCQNGRIVDHWGQPPINDFQKSEKKTFSRARTGEKFTLFLCLELGWLATDGGRHAL